MWLFGCIADVQGRVVAVVVARVHKNEKNPVNIGLQGLSSSPSVAVLPEIVCWQVVTLAEVPAVVACATQD